MLTGSAKAYDAVRVAGTITNIGCKFTALLKDAKIGRTTCVVAVLLAIAEFRISILA